MTNKPLTIDELKALEVGDWVWLVNLHIREGQYIQICYREQGRVFEGKYYTVVPNFRTYGQDWVAYKNKEQSEAKGEIVELPCVAMIEQGLVDGRFEQTMKAQQFNGYHAVVYLDKKKYKKPLIDVCWSKDNHYGIKQAEARLKELKGEKK